MDETAEFADDRVSLDELAAEFLERRRDGQSPTVSEYADRFPELADEIRDLFPTIAALEELKSQRDSAGQSQPLPRRLPIERLGDFRIVKEIGRGGMGIVLEAFQESLGRPVAVKVLPQSSLPDPKRLKRFHREAQTAARLHHTNIVPVFGVGEQDGFHYIVMQLIRGVDLNSVLAQLRRLAPEQSEGLDFHHDGQTALSGSVADAARMADLLARAELYGAGGRGPSSSAWGDKSASDSGNESTVVTEGSSPGSDGANADSQDSSARVRGGAAASPRDPALVQRDRVASLLEAAPRGRSYFQSVAIMGMQVADALHYAHTSGTLHRDIKPANLLLDSQGTVWISDFGLAKALEQDDVTQAGGIVGTLRYMAPEQFQGRVDARSDVYSLGLTLYEMLTLRPAYDDAHRASLLRKIAHEEPLRPRRIRPEIPHDLETIVLKAIARDPEHRYATAGALADDLRCFLEDRPIQARRASPWERLWRWARRNRLVAALASSTLTLLIVATAVASVGYVQTRSARDEEARQRRKAEAISSLATEAIDNIFDKFALDRIPTASSMAMIDDADDEVTVHVPPALSEQNASLLEHMLVYYDRLAQQDESDAALRRKVAEANRRIGDIRQRLGDYEASLAAYQRAIEGYRRLAVESLESRGLRAEIARAQNELGNVYELTNNSAAGRAAHQEALSTLRGDDAGESATAAHRYELARTYYFLVKWPGRWIGPPVVAIGGLRVGRPGAPAGTPGQPKAGSKERSKEPPSSKTAGKALPPGPPGKSPGPGSQGGPGGPSSRMAAFFLEERDRNLKAAVGLLRKLVEERPEVPDYRRLLALCHREIPPSFGQKPDPAEEGFQKATRILQDLVREHPDIPDYRQDLCETYAMWVTRKIFSPGGADVSHQETLRKALALSEELVASHPNVPDYTSSQVYIRWTLANLRWQSDPVETEAGLKKSLELQASLVSRYPKTSFYSFFQAVIQSSLAQFWMQRDRLPEARSMQAACIASLQAAQQLDPRAPVGGALRYNYAVLAQLLRRMGDDKSADEAQRQADALRRGA